MKIVTMIEGSYVSYVENWLESMRRAGMSLEPVTVYCADNRAYELLGESVQKRRISYPFMREERFGYGSPEWKHFLWLKMDLFTELLHGNEPILWSDPDVFFHRNPLHWFETQGLDLIGSQHLEQGYSFFCDGFFCVFPTDAARRLFKPSREEFDRWCNHEELLNARLVTENVKWLGLPTNLFPDGSFKPWCGEAWVCKSKDRYISHFNCISGSEKQQAMKAAGCWITR